MQDFVEHGKHVLRSGLNLLHLDLTRNLRYDRLTRKVIRRLVRPGDTCIDVGSHRGDILELMLKYSPEGNHFGFEPIPHLYQALHHKYASRCRISPYALSDFNGEVDFQWVRNAPAYSGLKKRTYETNEPEIEEIKVQARRLDDVMQEVEGLSPACVPIKLIKIDVEGAEYQVLKGAMTTLRRDQPVVIFEFGLGASDHYGVTAEMMYKLLAEEAGLQISLLDYWLDKKPALDKDSFCEYYITGKEYYFIAYA